MIQSQNTKQEEEKSIWNNFTGKYALSKTLRFELKPIGETLQKMRENLGFDEKLQTFFKDQEIENAYQALKSVFDKLHEEFITASLKSEEAKKINFAEYFDLYKKQKMEQNKEEKKKLDRPLEIEEERLRKSFISLYETEGGNLKNKVGKDEKGKDILKEDGFKVLTEAGILEYVRSKIDDFAEMKLKTRDGEEVTKQKLEKALGGENSDGVFTRFFTYFSGFNQNRENYYSTEEKATAVASRIVDENLSKFCDNTIVFENRKDEYLNCFKFLEKKNITLKDKDGNDLYPISGHSFIIERFNECLTQKQIDEYNKQIGNANFVINLYNQQKSKDDSKFKKLSVFKILYKQIGCGDKKDFITVIQTDEELKNSLLAASEAGKKYFTDNKNENEEVVNVFNFADFIQNHENYKGVYWSDKALNTISGKYFANWFALKKELKKAKVFRGKIKDDEDVIIPQAIELADLFEVLNKDAENKNWQEKGILFKASLFEKGNEKKKEIIEKGENPSQALLAMIFYDVKENAENFLKETKEVLKITDYKKDENKQKIKNLLDKALWVNQILKYFKVKANKITGETIDAKIENGLDVLVFSQDNPVKDYDGVRNYLTKKPQEGAMDNKLKLNFENSQLLGGWPDGQEKAKGAVLLRKDGIFYLGILKKKNIFDKKIKDNPIYKNSTKNTGRMILINLAFKTLAGKGFKNLFGEKYSNMGKREPLNAIKLLKQVIKNKYVEKYPMLQKILDTNYSEKKKFDSEIAEILKEMYVCDFKPINWDEVEKFVKFGELYLFKIKYGEKKIQSLYWNHVFTENSSIQLTGQGKIFYRKVAIKDRKIKNGYENKPWVIENKRFTEEKFLYHQSLKINYKEKFYGKPVYAINEINTFINKELANDKNLFFLGVDRGEKHLAYYSLTNQKGEIIDQNSFNLPFFDKDGKPRSVKASKYFEEDKKQKEDGAIEWKPRQVDCWNYNELLDARASNRDMARKNWQTIGTIKELKDGYISQVVRKIVDLAVKNKAFIVLEDLNIGFKRGRQKIEKQVYQKLELALAKKLNFLVDKNANDGEIGSVANALQLTPPVNNFGDMENKKQFGIMLYTKANYTSQTDPITGWRKSIYLKKGSEEYIKNQICDEFRDIGFDGEDYYFDYQDKNTGTKWRLYSGFNGKSLSRFKGELGDKNEWIRAPQDIMKILNGVFEDFDLKRSLLSQIIDEKLNPKKIDQDHTGWESLRFAIDLIQQIRNSGTTERDTDFIFSPVRDEKGNHFDSRVYWDKEQKGEKSDMPSSGDANGAFNIARKGIIMNEHIKKGYSLFISDLEWDAWLAGRKEWEQWLKDNESTLKFKKLK